MAIQPTQPQGIGGVLDTTFQLYKASIAVVWPLCLLMALASSPPSIYMLLQGISAATDPFAVLALMRGLTYWLIYGVTLVLTIWVWCAISLKQYSIGIGEEQSIGAALQGSFSRLAISVVMTILFILAIGIGSILLIIPGLILMVSLILAWNLVLFEKKGPVESLTGSHNLVWGNWWRTAAILTVGFIIVFVIYMAAGLLMGVFAGIFGGSDPLFTAMLSGLLVGALMSLLVTPFYVALMIAIYWDLKLRKEGGDLAARVGALGTA